MAGPLLEPENFIEDSRLHIKCGYHVQIIYYGHAIVNVFVDLVAILIGLIVFSYPQKHRETPIYRQMLQHYDRIHAYHYQLIYNILILIWISMFFIHILTIGLAILAVQMKKPWLMLPQLSLLLLRIGVLLVMFLALTVMNIVGDELMLTWTLTILFFLVAAIGFLVSTVFCFRFVLEKYNIMQKILANTKSVHFKERKRRN